MSRDQWSQTPASNDLSGYGQTGMAPSKVKNAFWDVMADLTVDASLPTSAGTANAQTVTNTRQFAALFTGMYQWFLPGFTNTGAVTLAVDGLAAKNIFANGVAAIAGMLATNVPALVKYDGTQWNLINPQRSTGSFTITLTGMTSATTGTVNYAISQDGKTVIAWVPSQIAGTSNTNSMTGTGVPNAIKSVTDHGPQILLEDAGGGVFSYFTGSNTNTWTFNKGTSGASGFTNSGLKGIVAAITIQAYTLD